MLLLSQGGDILLEPHYPVLQLELGQEGRWLYRCPAIENTHCLYSFKIRTRSDLLASCGFDWQPQTIRIIQKTRCCILLSLGLEYKSGFTTAVILMLGVICRCLNQNNLLADSEPCLSCHSSFEHISYIYIYIYLY